MHTRVFLAAAVVALLASPGYAQNPVPRYGDLGKPKSADEIEQERASERAYKTSLGNIADKPAADPWGAARSVSEPATGAKTSPARSHAKAAAKSTQKTKQPPSAKATGAHD